jgi:hypothetical protein
VRHRASVLRQLIIASRQGLDGLNLVAVRARRPCRGFVRKIAGETREPQSIVTVESQLGVSWPTPHLVHHRDRPTNNVRDWMDIKASEID